MQSVFFLSSEVFFLLASVESPFVMWLFYLRLLEMYLDPKDGKEPMFKAAVRLLHNHGEALDPLQVLEVQVLFLYVYVKIISKH